MAAIFGPGAAILGPGDQIFCDGRSGGTDFEGDDPRRDWPILTKGTQSYRLNGDPLGPILPVGWAHSTGKMGPGGPILP